MMTPMTRLAHPIVRVAALILLALGLSASTAAADTLMMPNRDALKGTSFVVWGVTTLPNGSSVSIDFGDGNPPTLGSVVDRSYITFNKNYTVAGPMTITMTVTSGATTEVASVNVQVFDPALITADTQRSVKINMAIEDGLRYLWTTSANRTTFNTNNFTNWGRPSWTALVVLAFENHGYQLPNNNSTPTGLYERFVVRRGLNTLMNGFANLTLNLQTAGNPCAGAAPAAEFGVSSTCVGYYSNTEGIGLAGYANALMILPFAGSGAFNRTNTEAGGVTAGKSFGEITQRLVNAMAWGQNDGVGNARGGWNYGFNQTIMDGSTAGWNILAILDAEAGGIVLPTFLKSEFTLGINKSFNTNGSFDYNADNNPANSVPHPALQNVARAGIGAQALFMIGSTAGSAQGVATQQFISNRWNGAFLAGDYTGTCNTIGNNKGCAYSMFNVFKGLKLLGVTTLPGVTRPAGPGAQPAGDWYADYQDYLITTQQSPATVGGGQWNMQFSCCTNSTEANVAIAELILSPVALVLPATLQLTPATNTALEGGTHTVTAKAESTGGTPVPGATVTFTILSGPNMGLTGTDVTDAAGEATFTYTDQGPIGTYGQDEIRASIGTLNSNIVVMNWTPLNRAPVATNNSYTSNEDAVLTGNVVTDAPPDSDPDGDPFTSAVVTTTTHGSLTLNLDGSFTYTPSANFCGLDSFTYDLSDGALSSNLATVSITVTCVNDPPVANDNAHTTPEDTPVSGVATSSDIDGGAPTYALASMPTNGTVVFNANGTYTYSPALNYNGPDSFTFTVSDGAGGTDGGQVNINVTPVNDAPVCSAAAPSIGLLWPPNHQLVNITVNGVTDPVEGSAITINVTGIWQDESTNSQGDGNTPIDGYGVGTSTAQVRAERSGRNDGRMYHIFFTGTDAQGGTCTGVVKVGVPHNQGNGNTVIDGGPLFNSSGV